MPNIAQHSRSTVPSGGPASIFNDEALLALAVASGVSDETQLTPVARVNSSKDAIRRHGVALGRAVAVGRAVYRRESREHRVLQNAA